MYTTLLRVVANKQTTLLQLELFCPILNGVLLFSFGVIIYYIFFLLPCKLSNDFRELKFFLEKQDYLPFEL